MEQGGDELPAASMLHLERLSQDAPCQNDGSEALLNLLSKLAHVKVERILTRG